ncbi:anti-sigma factor family protein [Flavihumibacter petaseus]|uniref:Uncharacterized protein n=1 Tax=Flavihumibacter petaseus NBRC 106054 TaxID=1220578 RepID=A0A0E9N1K5_9BACT|nr:hypothetical protein [Flavihumibacter petaseus]GAO43658.1 hypothetical protein FPE01S_02_07640 [Flavihumibacter petaseus NBRC 106054]
MNRDLLNILSHSNKDIDNQLLMDYLNGVLSQQDQHLVEEWLEENPFAADAMEGLQAFDDKTALHDYVKQLNADLKKHLEQKKQRREKRRWKDNPIVYIALVLILILIILAYIVLHYLGVS